MSDVCGRAHLSSVLSTLNVEFTLTDAHCKKDLSVKVESRTHLWRVAGAAARISPALAGSRGSGACCGEGCVNPYLVVPSDLALHRGPASLIGGSFTGVEVQS